MKTGTFPKYWDELTGFEKARWCDIQTKKKELAKEVNKLSHRGYDRYHYKLKKEQ